MVGEVDRLVHGAEDAGKQQHAERACNCLVDTAEVVSKDMITPLWDHLGPLFIRAQDFFLRISKAQIVEAIWHL
jgi:hypothetical protein